MNYLKKLLTKTIFWLNCARLYSLPMTILSWLVIFVFALKHNGSIIAGIIALIGISFAHLSTNLIDDYVDYKVLSKDENFVKAGRDCKCEYLRTNQATVNDLRNTIIIMLAIAAFTGLILLFLSGPAVILLAIIGLMIALLYPTFSMNGLGEILVIIAYGPLMFEGVYYVMTKNFSWEVLVLSITCVMFVNSVLYAHMLMDFDGDKKTNKKTLCIMLKTKTNALNFMLIFYITSYILILYITYLTKNYLYLTTLITIPMVADLHKYLGIYNKNPNEITKNPIWNYPLDNWKNIVGTYNEPFYLRFYMTRNISTYFMLLTTIAIIFG